MTNLMAVTPKSPWPWVRTLLHSVFDQPNSESVAAQYDRIVDALTDKLPKIADHLEAARPDLLASTPRSPSSARAGRTIALCARTPERLAIGGLRKRTVAHHRGPRNIHHSFRTRLRSE
jgi:hypothetical protein